MILLIDYGAGNLGSVLKAARRVGLPVEVGDDSRDVEKADGLILPGVGALAQGRERLDLLGLSEPIRRYVASDRPFLGICLGLQLLFGPGEEGGEGLGILPGSVPRLRGEGKIPEMGWNRVEPVRPSPLFRGLEGGGYFYFVHSYFVDPADQSLVLARTEYGHTFTSAVARGRLFGVQFHPEKSGELGLMVLENFGEVVRGAA